MAAGVNVPGAEAEECRKEQNEIDAILRKRIERRRKAFLENMPLIFKYKDWILAEPGFADVSVAFLIDAARPFSLGALFSLWENPVWQGTCGCGGLACIHRFSGSPLSGSYTALATCSVCGKTFRAEHAPGRTFTVLAKTYGEQSAKSRTGEPQISFEMLLDALRLKEIDFSASLSGTGIP